MGREKDMLYAFSSKEATVSSDGNNVTIQPDDGQTVVFPVTQIRQIRFTAPTGQKLGAVTFFLSSAVDGSGSTVYIFHLDSDQFVEARSFEYALRQLSQSVSISNSASSRINSMFMQSNSSNGAFTSTQSEQNTPWWISLVSAIVALAVGLAVGWGITSHKAKTAIASKNAQIESAKKELDETQRALDSVQQQLEDSQNQNNGSATQEDSANPKNTEGKPNEEVANGGITMKLLEFGEKSTISFDSCGHGCSNGKFAPRNPDKDTKYWVVKVEVTNNTKKPLDITCGYPYEIIALNSDNQEYTPIDDLYDVEGNPECNAQLQPGTKATVTYPFQVPLSAKMIGIAFRDIGDFLSGEKGQDNYAIILTDDNYSVSR